MHTKKKKRRDKKSNFKVVINLCGLDVSIVVELAVLTANEKDL